MGISADQARQLASTNQKKAEPPPQLSYGDEIRQRIQLSIDDLMRKIEAAARAGKTYVASYLSPMPLPDHLKAPPKEKFMIPFWVSDDDYSVVRARAQSSYDFGKCPRTLFGRIKTPSDFETNPYYLNAINKAVFDHFASLGYSVSLDYIADDDPSSASPASVGIAVRW